MRERVLVCVCVCVCMREREGENLLLVLAHLGDSHVAQSRGFLAEQV